MKTTQHARLCLLCSTLLFAAGTTLAQSAAVVGSGPGVAAGAQTVKITATITAVDKATRAVTLRGPEGNAVTVTAGPDVKNFDRLKIGDQVNLQYLEALAIELKKGGGLTVGRTEKADAAGARKGERPGAAAAREITIVADVVGVDPARQVVSLRGPNRTVELRIPDPEQFKRIAKGDQVEARYAEAVAIAVEPTTKK